MGSCDNYIDDNSVVVALNSEQYESWMCNARCAEITDVDTGRVATIKIADRCVGCGWGSLDFTPGSLRAIGRNTGTSVFSIRWRFVNC